MRFSNTTTSLSDSYINAILDITEIMESNNCREEEILNAIQQLYDIYAGNKTMLDIRCMNGTRIRVMKNRLGIDVKEIQ